MHENVDLTLKPTSFAGIGRLKDVTSVWKGKTAADSQRDQHVSRTFSTLENCGFWVYKLNCIGHRRFLFFPRRAETSFLLQTSFSLPQTADVSSNDFHVYSQLTAYVHAVRRILSKQHFNGQMTGKLLPHDDEYFRHLLWYLFINATLCCREIPKIFGIKSNKTAPWKTDFLKQRLILRQGLEQHK